MNWGNGYGPYGRISLASRPGAQPQYTDRSSTISGSGVYTQSKDRREPPVRAYSRATSTTIPPYGGRFGELSSDRHGRSMSYRDIYPGAATTDPDHVREYGPEGWPGFGHLVEGIDGGRSYGYRDVPSDHALAEWERDTSPFRPGYANEGYRLASWRSNNYEDFYRGYGGALEGRRADRRTPHGPVEVDAMRQQWRENDQGGRLMDMRGSDLTAERDLDEFMASYGDPRGRRRFEEAMAEGHAPGFGRDPRGMPGMGRHEDYNHDTHGNHDFFRDAGGWDDR